MLMLSSVIMMVRNKSNKKVETAAAFGLIAMGLTVLETVYFVIQWRRYGMYTQKKLLDDPDD